MLLPIKGVQNTKSRHSDNIQNTLLQPKPMQAFTFTAVCVGFLILSPRTVPNVSAYRPDYLFHTVTGVLGGHPSKSY